MVTDPEQQAILAALADHQAGRFAAAERAYLAVLARRPWHPAALHLAGVAAHQQGRHAEAVDRITSAIGIDPGRAEFHLNLGSALLSLGKVAAAEQCFATATQLDPRLPEGHFNRSLALQRMGRPEAAEVSVRQAVALRPRYPQALSTLAALLSVRRQYDEAAAVARAALAIDPRHVPAHTALADTCRRTGDLAGARAWCERALAFAPESAEAHATLAVVLLLAGDYDAGWREYEWRFGFGDQAAARRRFPGPTWDGSPLAGRTLLLWVEQGLGDAIMFVRFARLATGGRVVVECAETLAALMRTAAGVDDVIVTGRPLPPFDVHCPLGSLPFVLRAGAEALAEAAPYLSPDPTRVAAWAARLAPLPRPRVGLVWAGNPTHLNDRNRSIAPADLLLLLLQVPGVSFVSLQLGGPAAALSAALSAAGVTDIGGWLTDLSETAAALANLDLLVTVDSVVNHLAGAMGVPAWCFLPFAADWRWGVGGAETRWYPAARLFRQSRPGDWTGPVADAAAGLADRVGRTPSPRPAGGDSLAPPQPG